MSDNPIDQALGLRPLDEAIEDTDTVVEDSRETSPAIIEEQTTELSVVNVDADESFQDIELARSNIKNMIEEGDEAFKELIVLAKSSESPRAYEVVSNLMKTLLDANKDFVDISTKKKYRREELLDDKEEKQDSQTNITNNNLILSTTDLLKMIKGEIE